jgi:hypothetical protein
MITKKRENSIDNQALLQAFFVSKVSYFALKQQLHRRISYGELDERYRRLNAYPVEKLVLHVMVLVFLSPA